MEFLRRCLDDPEAAACGRCDNCAQPLFDADVSPASLAAANAFLGRPGVEIAPKKMWPTGLSAVGISLKGKIAPAEQIEPGRAVGRLSDLGWGNRLRSLVSPESPDVPARSVIRNSSTVWPSTSPRSDVCPCSVP
jgi:ATP-dependent DNA helicase RecQ